MSTTRYRARIKQPSPPRQEDDAIRRAALIDQFDWLKDLYLLGDLTKAQYIMRCQAFQEELERLEPTINPDLAQAVQLLSNFSDFRKIETAPPTGIERCTERERRDLNPRPPA